MFFPYVQFNFCNTNYSFFYLVFIHLPKFKRGQGQTSVILLIIKFFKLYLKSSLTNSLVTNIENLATLNFFFHGCKFVNYDHFNAKQSCSNIKLLRL